MDEYSPLGRRWWVASALASLIAGGTATAATPSLERLRAQVDGAVEVSQHPGTGQVRFLRFPDSNRRLFAPASATTAEQRARDVLAEVGELFGLSDADRELRLVGTATDPLGGEHVSFTQSHRGLPVFASMLRVHFDAAGGVVAVNGFIVPVGDLAVRPMVVASQGRVTAIAATAAALRARGEPARSLRSRPARLVVVAPGPLAGRPGPAVLAWEVEVLDAAAALDPGRAPAVRERVLVDAHRGIVLLQLPQIHSALTREIARGSADSLVWREGDPRPYSGSGSATDDAAIERLITGAGEAYQLFANLSAGTFLSFDGDSAPMRSVYDADSLRAACPNASWNGTTTNFCPDTAIDDVIVHEWTHAFTDHTHDLIYWWQPGALNEAYSDIFGETSDLLNGSGTDAPDAARSTGGCSTLASATLPELRVLQPAALAGAHRVGPAAFGPPLAAAPTEALVALARDAADATGPSQTDACSALTNGDAVAGRIALLDRGTCEFTVKVGNAQRAGAVAAIVVNHGDGLLRMGGEDPSVSIPSVLVTRSVGQQLRNALGLGLRVRLGLREGTDASVRWLIGEDAAGTGQAIRDLWSPACLGHPSRLSDPLYFCPNPPADRGGVHRNSGVPNRAFALFADGGEVGGQRIGGVGLTRAAHVYWRAMRLYQVPATDFADHADALEQACADLAEAGTELPALLSGEPSGEVVTAAHCGELAEAIAAVELRGAWPCEFGPILDAAPRLLCPAGQGPQSLLRSTFDSTADGWVASEETNHDGPVPEPWTLTAERSGWRATFPDGRQGQGFFADRELAYPACLAWVDDPRPQVKRLLSPIVTMPPGNSPVRLAIDHWVATGTRGGANLKVSVDGGVFVELPNRALLSNGYNERVYPSREFFNHGELAWVGTNLGSLVDGGWGRTLVDLSAVARPGQQVRLRLDYAEGACDVSGLFQTAGWYVDEVHAYRCGPVTACGDHQTLCLGGGRFLARVRWSNQYNGTTGPGIALPQSELAGLFAFDDPANVELMVKVIDFGDAVRVFYGQLTDLRFELSITDTTSGTTRVYGNTEGECGGIDQTAFPKLGVADSAVQPVAACTTSPSTLCLLDGRFAVEIDWHNQYDGSSGSGTAASLSPLAGTFSFADPRNTEVLVKALDFGDHVLVAYGSLSDLEYTVRVLDTTSGAERTYHNPAGRYCGGLDADAF